MSTDRTPFDCKESIAGHCFVVCATLAIERTQDVYQYVGASGVTALGHLGASSVSGRPKHKLQILRKSPSFIEIPCIWLNNLKIVERIK
jgi:hypothetical protein